MRGDARRGSAAAGRLPGTPAAREMAPVTPRAGQAGRSPGRGTALAAWCRRAGALTAAVVAACGSAAPAPRPSPPASSAAAPPVSPGDPRAAALRAYLGIWNAYVTASRTAGYQSPSLARYAAGDALSVLIRGLYADYRDGMVTRGQPSFGPHVTITSSGTTARASVADCAGSSRWLDYCTDTGRPGGAGQTPGEGEAC